MQRFTYFIESGCFSTRFAITNNKDGTWTATYHRSGMGKQPQSVTMTMMIAACIIRDKPNDSDASNQVTRYMITHVDKKALENPCYATLVCLDSMHAFNDTGSIEMEGMLMGGASVNEPEGKYNGVFIFDTYREKDLRSQVPQEMPHVFSGIVEV